MFLNSHEQTPPPPAPCTRAGNGERGLPGRLVPEIGIDLNQSRPGLEKKRTCRTPDSGPCSTTHDTILNCGTHIRTGEQQISHQTMFTAILIFLQHGGHPEAESPTLNNTRFGPFWLLQGTATTHHDCRHAPYNSPTLSRRALSHYAMR